jgi:hypothetical protein
MPYILVQPLVLFAAAALCYVTFPLILAQAAVGASQNAAARPYTGTGGQSSAWR